MLDLTFALLVVFAILLMIIGVEYEDEHDYWNMIPIAFSIVIFLALAGAVMNIEIPYEIYNATSGEIETGFHVHGYDYSLSFLFLGIACIESAYLFIHLFMKMGIIAEDTFRRKYRRRY